MSAHGKIVAVLGGDRRMAEAARLFLRAGLRVRAAGLPWEGRPEGVQICSEAGEALDGADVAVLPVQGVTADGQVYTEPGAPPCRVDRDGLRRLRPGATLFVGVSNPTLTRGCDEAGVAVMAYRESEEFATWNSIPSAEGAIQMAMELTPFTIFGSRSLVVGFGRTGKAVALLLRGLFSQVSVSARSEVDLARAWACGYRPVEWAKLGQAVAEADLIFNTVPAPVLTRSVLSGAPRHAAVIDLASAPGGTDFEAAAALGLTARLAPGLPGLVAPATAGRIIAELVLRHLERSPVEEEER